MKKREKRLQNLNRKSDKLIKRAGKKDITMEQVERKRIHNIIKKDDRIRLNKGTKKCQN